MRCLVRQAAVERSVSKSRTEESSLSIPVQWDVEVATKRTETLNLFKVEGV